MKPERITKSHHRLRTIYMWKQYGAAWLFVLPWAIGFGVFMAFPLGWSLFMSFNKVKLTTEGFQYTWVGLDNFRRALFEDNVYPIQLITYFQQVILMIPMIVLFAFFVSILLNQRFPLRFLFRGIFFLPVIFSTGQVLMELFRQGSGELPFLQQYDIAPIVREYVGERLAAPLLDILSRAVIILWYSGVQILIFLAGFQTISRTIYEAVRIDGAGPWESFWKITLPAMVPFITLNVLYTIVDLFTFPFNPVMDQIKANMFRANTGYGYASALAWLYFLLIFILIAITLWLGRRSTKIRR